MKVVTKSILYVEYVVVHRSILIYGIYVQRLRYLTYHYASIFLLAFAIDDHQSLANICDQVMIIHIVEVPINLTN